MKPGPIGLFLRELLCRMFGHDWQPMTHHKPGYVMHGNLCIRCGDFEGQQRRGNYPIPR